MDKKLSRLKRFKAIQTAPNQIIPIELDRIDDQLETLKSNDEQIAQSITILDKNINEVASDLENKISKVKTIKGDKGDKGDSIKGEKGDKGDKGDTTIVEKVIERTEVIKEIPIVTENVVKTIKEDVSGETIIQRINDNEKDKIKVEKIEGIKSYDDEIATLQNRTQLLAQISTQNKRDTLQSVTDNGSATTNKITVPGVQISISATPSASTPGLIQWNSTDGTYDMGLLNSSVLQVGQETMFYGKASGAIANGDLCQFAGVQGDHILIKKAVGSEIEANPHYLVGVATENIANGTFGYVTWFGKVNGVYTKTPANQDTVNWVAGDILYFNVSTGQMTKTMPSVPNRIITVAAVIKEQTGSSESGIIIVRPTWGHKLQDLDDVNGTALTATGQIPVWNNTAGYFDFDYNITNYLKKDGTDAGATSQAQSFTNGIKTNTIAPTSSPNDITVSCGTDKTIVLGETVWADIDFPIIIRTVGTGIPTLETFNGNLTMPQWQANDYNQCESQEFIHEWKEGTTCYWHVHLNTNGLDVTDRYVKFELEYGYSANGTWTFPTAITTSDIKIPANTPDRTQIIMSIGNFTPSTSKIGDHAIARLKRVTSTGTAPTNNPFIPMLQMHIEKDTVGSRQMTSK